MTSCFVLSPMAIVPARYLPFRFLVLAGLYSIKANSRYRNQSYRSGMGRRNRCTGSRTGACRGN